MAETDTLQQKVRDKLHSAEDHIYASRSAIKFCYTDDTSDHVDVDEWAKALAEATVARSQIDDAIKLLVEMKRDA